MIVKTQSGGRQTFQIQNGSEREEIVRFNEPDEAISGFIRHNIRGVRVRVSLSYETDVQRQLLADIMRSIQTDLFDLGLNFIEFSFDDTNFIRMVPSDQMRRAIEYNDQLLRVKPFIGLVSQPNPTEVLIDDHGYISDPPDIIEDHGLIIDTVDTIEDHGTVT